MSEQIKLIHQNALVSSVADRQITVEPTADADLGFKMWGGKDADGATQKFLAKDENARVDELTVQDLAGSGEGFVAVDNAGKVSHATSAGTAGTLQQTLDNGSTATIATDIELEIEQDAPLSGTANPIYVRERIRNTAPASATTKASEMRRRSEGVGGTSYSEVRQFVGESDTQRDFISEIRATDTWAATVRCRVFNGVSEIVESAQTKTETIAGDRTATMEKDVLLGTVTDTESVKNIGLGAMTGDVSFAKKVIIVESDNDTAGGLGTAGRLTLTAEASNEAGYDGDSAFSVDAFDGANEKRIVSSGILGGTTFHDIIAQSFLVNGEPQGVQFVSTVADTPHVMTIASAKKIIFEGSASNAVCELPAANSTATLSDGTVVTMRGRSFELVNSSSEFVPVKNSGTASSVFELLGPGCTLTATCTGTSTAAGAWTYSKTKKGSFPLAGEYETDFDEIASVGWTASNGTGASLVTNGVVAGGPISGMSGYHFQMTGTSAPVIHQSYYRQAINIGTGARLIRHRIQLYNIPSGADDFVYESGLFATANAIEATNGIFLKAPANASGLTTWHATSFSATATTSLNTTVVVANTAIDLFQVVNAAGTRVDFWLGKAYGGKIETNLPAGTVSLYPGVKIVKTVGTTLRVANIDYANHAYYPTTQRS